MVMAGMGAPSECKKEARSNACLAASDILGRSGRETRSEIRQNSGGFAQACAAARAASRKPVFGRFFSRVVILSGSNHALNGQMTLVRLAKRGETGAHNDDHLPPETTASRKVSDATVRKTADSSKRRRTWEGVDKKIKFI
jgi:hypothetical protein